MGQITKTALQRKIELVNWVILGAATAVSFIFFPYQGTLGILCGGLISILNYYWLAKDVASLLQRLSGSNGLNKPKRFILLRYSGRLVVTGGVLFIVITRVPVSVIGLFLGLSVVLVSFMLTVVIENVKNPLRRFKEKDASFVTFR